MDGLSGRSGSSSVRMQEGDVNMTPTVCEQIMNGTVWGLVDEFNILVLSGSRASESSDCTLALHKY